jgi:hypothetical protein
LTISSGDDLIAKYKKHKEVFMKVAFKHNIRTITGKDRDEDIVYIAANKKRVAFLHRYTYPQNTEFKANLI